LIIFHVFGAFLFVCFIAGVSPLLIPPMRTPSRSVTKSPLNFAFTDIFIFFIRGNLVEL
jgi:hypothetical protein